MKTLWCSLAVVIAFVIGACGGGDTINGACRRHSDCTSCVSDYGCGWCVNICVAGDHYGPTVGECTDWTESGSTCGANGDGGTGDVVSHDSSDATSVVCTRPSATGTCSNVGDLYCGARCCPSSAAYYCSSTASCYTTESAAESACGSHACSICIAPQSSGTCSTTFSSGSCSNTTDLYCGGGHCCDSAHPYSCSSTGLCYATEASAAAACGSSSCYSCVTQTRMCTAPSSTGTCSTAGNLYCGSICCDTAHPYACSTTGYCYGTQSAALSACGSTPCSTCVTAQAPNHVVNCGATGHVSPEWCECLPADSNTGSVVFNGGCQPDPTFAPMICCETSSFPSTGSCTCYLTEQWACQNFNTDCSCSNYWDASYTNFTTVCNNAPDSAGNPWRCCNDRIGGCTCTQNGGPCASGQTEVSDCTNASALGYAAAMTYCPSGTYQVSTCH